MSETNNQIAVSTEADGFAGYPEVEELIRKSKPTIIRLWKDGAIPAPERVSTPTGKSIFLGFRRSELREWAKDPTAWVNKHCRKAAA